MIRRAHAEYFLALAERAELALMGPEQGEWCDRLEREHGNLRAALAWAIGRSEAETALRLGGALWLFWRLREHVGEGRTWLERALSLAGGTEVARAKALEGAGALEGMLGNYRAAIACFEEALVLRRQAGESFGIARGLHLLGMAWCHAGDYDRAAQLLEEALGRYGMPDDEFGKSWLCLALNEWAAVLAARGDAERAIILGETVLAQQRELGNQLGISLALYFLGRVRRHQGDLVGAAATYREGLTLLAERGEARHHAPYVPSFLLGLAILAAAEGRPERAVTLAAAGTALRASADIRPFPLAQAALEHALTTSRTALGEVAFAAAWERGSSLSIEQAVTEALAQDPEPTLSSARRTARSRQEPAASGSRAGNSMYCA